MPKGAKTCPKCHATVGCRAHECECGHKFLTAIAGTPEYEKAAEEEGFFPVTGYVILTPAGAPPAYKGDLAGWAAACQAKGDLAGWAAACQAKVEGRATYSAGALRYWLGGLVSRDEFRELSPRLPALCGEAHTEEPADEAA